MFLPKFLAGRSPAPPKPLVWWDSPITVLGGTQPPLTQNVPSFISVTSERQDMGMIGRQHQQGFGEVDHGLCLFDRLLQCQCLVQGSFGIVEMVGVVQASSCKKAEATVSVPRSIYLPNMGLPRLARPPSAKTWEWSAVTTVRVSPGDVAVSAMATASSKPRVSVRARFALL